MDEERVQSIASLSKQDQTIPSHFIRSATEQPGETTVHGVVLEVPVIDVSTGDEKKTIEAIREASVEWGMFQVVNHGIPDHVISKLQQVGREFFELPIEQKEVIKKTPESGIEGYGTNLQKVVDGKKGWVDHLFHKLYPPSVVKYSIWPPNPPSYREATEDYGERLRKVSDDLMKWLSLGLGLEPQCFKVAVGGDEMNFLLKINYYPPCPCPDLVLGVVAHTDMSALTILVPNEIPGLQVFRNEHWYDVRYIPNALIIHIGDQMEIMSNGKYKAVLHRTTVSKDCTRMSWPVFLEPPGEREIGPVPELVDEKNPAKYKTKKFKDYAYCKLNKIPQ